MIGNHVYGNHRTRGSNPRLSAKKPRKLLVYAVFSFCRFHIHSCQIERDWSTFKDGCYTVATDFFQKNALGSYCPRADFMPFLKSHCIMFLPLGWYSDLYQPKNPCAPSGLWCPLAAPLRRSYASRMFCGSYEGLNLRETVDLSRNVQSEFTLNLK